VNRIADYALIGDCHSVALVGRDGSIDWACFPRFDSPAAFCKLLDAERGGAFSLAPREVESVRRAYLDDTNVLVTVFSCAGGELELTDCMPVGALDPARPTRVATRHAILRRARCIAGKVDVALELAPRFEYAGFVPRFELTGDGSAEVYGGADALYVSATRLLDCNRERIVANWRLEQGDEAWIEVRWSPSSELSDEPRPDAAVFAERLETTTAFWRKWIESLTYAGEHRAIVRRSALVLKAMTYAPTGAVIAAPTTSLPEQIGGARNWDYRYTWIRDATLTLISLFTLGLSDEAHAFKVWLERTGAGRPEDLQIMYRIRGERAIPELELGHLSGHRGSRPVRIGNAASGQVQLDAYGQILEAAYLYAAAGHPLSPSNWSYLAGLADIACDRWRTRDSGIWEMRDTPRHFTHSKLGCWLALDRALKLAAMLNVAPGERWPAERDALSAFLLDETSPNGWFRQAAGVDAPDAATLLIPALGFLPTTHPKVLQTIEVVRRDLERDGFVYRYLNADGLEGGEGTFLLCSFWLLDCLIHAGRLDDAERLLERLLGAGNDLDLFAEQIEPSTRELLGNFPQAFTHMALVSSCAHLSAAKRGLLPQDGAAYDYSELALGRLLAERRRA
jgi:GH15 family glucan-1,4-alpha-glucosidase